MLLGLLRLLVGLLVVVTAVPAILALAGFVVPVFDLFNHLQVLLLVGTALAVVLALLVGLPTGWKVLAVVGLLSSAWTFGPEWLAGLTPRPAATGGPVIKVMTHNVFGLNYDMPRVAAVIAAEQPDIVALQEYFPEQTRLDALLKAAYPYSARCQGGKRANIALYSKIPFDREMPAGDCPDDAYGTQRTAHIIAGFTLADGTHFSVLTTHMDWPFPIDRQLAEFQSAETSIKAVKGPLVVVGDFNSTPWSYAMKAFERDSGLKRETHALITYPLALTVPRRISRDGLLRTLPFLPLDQVFQRGVVVSELHAGAPTGSDHLPVVFSFEVPKAAPTP